MAQSTVEHSKRVIVDLTEEGPLRILHVDDEAGFLKAAKPCLEMQGAFQVDTTLSVEEAMEKIKDKAYDAIVSDYVMPGKDGLQFLKELRDEGNNIPFIMFTGKGREEVAIKALNFGADQYLNKTGYPETVYGELAHSIRKAVERKRAEDELVRLSSAVRMSIDGIVIGDINAKIIDVNEATLKMYGSDDKADLVGRNSFDLIAIEDQEKAFAGMKETLEKGYTKGREYHVISKAGSKILVEMNSAIMKDTDGKPMGLVSIIRDVTERKRMEEVLRKSEEQFRNIFENASDAMIYLDKSGRILDVNRKAVELFGGSKEELLGEHFTKVGVLSVRDIPRLMSSFAKGLMGKKITINLCIKNKKGQEVYLECSTSSMKMHDKPTGRLIIARDITEKRKAEEQIRESEEKYRNIVELAPDCIMTFDMKGVVTSVNSASTRLSGYSKDELIGKHFTKIGPVRSRDIPKYLKMFSSTLRGTVAKPFEVVYSHKDGTTHRGEVRFSFLKEKGKTIGLQAIMRDITERRKAEKAIEESEKKSRILMDEAPIAICNTDMKGKINYVNKRFEELSGYSREEIVGKSGWKFISDETFKLLRRRMKARLIGKPSRLQQVQFKCKDGKWVWVEMESKIIKKFGIPVGFQHIARDITERKKAEKELTETLERWEVMNEKLGVVGKLTRHDARNKLSAVTMNAFLAKQKLAGDHEALEHLREIELGCGQVEKIFDFARIYEMLGVEELVYMDVEKTLEEAVMLFSDLHGVKVVNDCRGLTVLADSLLRQLFYNLIDNSLKHGERVSQIRVHYEEEGKNRLRLVYEDDGVGIPKKEKEKVFAEGYGKGTGYGLYLIKKMCEVYGWNIQETGKHGKGALFTIIISKMGKKGNLNYKLHS